MIKVNLIDCGSAKKQTRGTWFSVFLELGPPPNNKLFIN